MIDHGLFWALIGAITALIYLKFQQWSVDRINPQNKSWSIKLIIGGAVLRWLLIIAVLILSISHSYRSMFIVFVTFMFVRLLILIKWQSWPRNKSFIYPQA